MGDGHPPGKITTKNWREDDILNGQEVGCQACGSGGLERLLDLGYQPLCNDFLPSGESAGPQTFYPLCLCFCHKCHRCHKKIMDFQKMGRREVQDPRVTSAPDATRKIIDFQKRWRMILAFFYLPCSARLIIFGPGGYPCHA